MRVSLVPRARHDLREVVRFLNEWSAAVAATTIEELDDAIAGLSHSPGRFPVIAKRRGRDIRRRVWKRHNIFCTVTPGRVVVLRVVHQSRDQAAILRTI